MQADGARSAIAPLSAELLATFSAAATYDGPRNRRNYNDSPVLSRDATVVSHYLEANRPATRPPSRGR